MHIHTHGSKGDPVIIILHPMGITGEKMYEVVGTKFRGEYYFITPDMGGHGSEKRKFRSARAEAAALHNYLQQKGLTKIRLLYGASLGCAVSLHLLRYEDLNIEYAYLDGAPVARLSAVMRKIFAPVLVWQQDMIIRNREKGISDFVKRYGRDIAEHMEVIVRPGKEHCEAMAQVPDYVEKIEERITGTRPVMIRLQGLDEDQIREISRQIADAFYDYKYNEEDIGLIRFIPTREDMFTYIYAIVRAAYRSGVLYTTSKRREGYLMLSGEGAGGAVGFVDGIKMIAAEKKALGGFQNMKQFIDACFSDGGTIETRMRKEKRKFLRIEMLVVRKEFQGQGYMHRMMDFAYALAEERRIPVILDTDDRDKASRYEHLGMKLDRVRSCGERFHMYDLIREDAVIGCL